MNAWREDKQQFVQREVRLREGIRSQAERGLLCQGANVHMRVTVTYGIIALFP